MKLRSLLFASVLATLSLAAAHADDRWDAPGAANPILPGYFADPSLVQHEGKFYLYATIDPWGGRTLGCWESGDFKNWTFRELNWPTKAACTSPTSGDSMVWAPSVIRAPDGRFMMYVSVGSEVWVGTATSPLGPWRDAHGGTPLIAATWNRTYHMIDAEAFVDDDGSVYLFWGSGWKWTNGHCFVVKLGADLASFDGEPRDATPAHYFEGPFLFKHAGRYYLTYSNGKTVTDTYQVHYATGPSPLGPFTEAPNSPLLTTDAARDIVSPGHHAMFHRGAQAFILYHRHRLPFVTETAFRQTCVDELQFTPDGLIEKVRPTHTGPTFVQGRDAGRLAAIASASSSLDALHGADRTTDDNYATRWAAAPTDRAATLTLDLGHAAPVDRLELRPESPTSTYAFILEASRDGQSWTTLADHRAPGLSGSPIVLPVGRECRYLRLTFPASSDAPAASLWECAVY
jgi:hypothetical protein